MIPLGQVKDARYEYTTLTNTPTPTPAPTRINTYLAWIRNILVYHKGISFCFADPHCSNETRFQEQRFPSRLPTHIYTLNTCTRGGGREQARERQTERESESESERESETERERREKERDRERQREREKMIHKYFKYQKYTRFWTS